MASAARRLTSMNQLGFKHGLDDSATFITVGDGWVISFSPRERPGSRGPSRPFAAFFGGEDQVIRTGSGGLVAIFADDLNALEVMTFADFKIIEIVGGG